MNRALRELDAYPMLRLAKRRAEAEAAGLEVFDFGTGDPREPTPRFVREALAAAVPEVSQYPRIDGSPELRAAFAGWFERRFGVRLDPDREVLPSRGSKEAIFHLPLILVDPGARRRAVLLPEPGYPVMRIGALFAGAEVVPYELHAGNDYLMDPSAVPDDVLARAALVWLNYPHNPTGRELPRRLFAAWVEARARHGFVLCSDECYADLYFGEPPASLLEFGREGCLAFHSLSKRSGMTGYRSGMIAGDAELIAELRRHRAAMGQAMPVFEEAASIAAWNDDRHAAERRRIFGAKRDLMRAGLGSRGLEVLETEATFYLWVRAPGAAEEYADELLARGILVSPGPYFGRGQEDWFRIALVPSLEDCRRALERWPES